MEQVDCENNLGKEFCSSNGSITFVVDDRLIGILSKIIGDHRLARENF